MWVMGQSPKKCEAMIFVSLEFLWFCISHNYKYQTNDDVFQINFDCNAE